MSLSALVSLIRESGILRDVSLHDEFTRQLLCRITNSCLVTGTMKVAIESTANLHMQPDMKSTDHHSHHDYHHHHVKENQESEEVMKALVPFPGDFSSKQEVITFFYRLMSTVVSSSSNNNNGNCSDDDTNASFSCQQPCLPSSALQDGSVYDHVVDILERMLETLLTPEQIEFIVSGVYMSAGDSKEEEDKDIEIWPRFVHSLLLSLVADKKKLLRHVRLLYINDDIGENDSIFHHLTDVFNSGRTNMPPPSLQPKHSLDLLQSNDDDTHVNDHPYQQELVNISYPIQVTRNPRRENLIYAFGAMIKIYPLSNNHASNNGAEQRNDTKEMQSNEIGDLGVEVNLEISSHCHIDTEADFEKALKALEQLVVSPDTPSVDNTKSNSTGNSGNNSHTNGSQNSNGNNSNGNSKEASNAAKLVSYEVGISLLQHSAQSFSGFTTLLCISTSKHTFTFDTLLLSPQSMHRCVCHSSVLLLLKHPPAYTNCTPPYSSMDLPYHLL